MIADCETCDRKQVPCKSCQESQRAICFICQSDMADPYFEGQPFFSTQWEREDYERGKRGERERGPGQYIEIDDADAMTRDHYIRSGK